MGLMSLFVISGCATVVGPVEDTPVENSQRLPQSDADPQLPGEPVYRPDGEPESIDLPQEDLSQNPAAQRPHLVSSAAKLLDKAQQQRQADNYDGALATLDRAVRLAPRNGELYLEMAKVRLLQQKYSLAQQLAEKSLSLSRGFIAIQEEAKVLIDQAKKALR